MITVTATLVGFDYSLVRAAQNLGASPARTFFKVQMPLILPGVISGAPVRLHHLASTRWWWSCSSPASSSAPPAPDVVRHPRADLADHPRGRDDPDRDLDPARWPRSSCCAAATSACAASARPEPQRFRAFPALRASTQRLEPRWRTWWSPWPDPATRQTGRSLPNHAEEAASPTRKVPTPVSAPDTAPLIPDQFMKP